MIGSQVSHYRVIAELGRGGMGVVYRAQDIRLHREVALKFLPKEFSENHAALERFQREARAASSLDHPNICAIHDVGEHDGQPFIVMSLLRGQTLKDRMGNRPMKVQDVVDYGIQIADALEAAHAKGVLHRDIKPANIFVTERNEATLLDFGLAKLASAARGDGEADTSKAATRTATELVTRPGTTLGTVAYMSPEQALGEEVDARSDLFSVGVVLYEMATGSRPFKGATAAATSNEIINKPPAALPALQAAIPPELERIVLKALEKDRALRYQTASDIGADLKRLRRTLQAGSGSAVDAVGLGRRPARPTAWTIAAATGAVVLALFLALAANRMLRSRESAPVSFQNAVSARVTDQPGPELFPSLSPDGRSIVYVARATDNWDIYLQRVGGQKPNNLTADSPVDDNHPAFSPDGERIAFQSDRNGGGIYLMGATGESVQRLTDFGYHPAWSPDGKEIVFASTIIARPESRQSSNSQLWVVTVATGERRRLEIKGGGDAIQPSWSPNGHRIAYWGSIASGQRDIWTVAATGGEAVSVTEDAAIDWNPVWAPEGRYLYFSSDRGGSMNLWRTPIDERSGRVLGPPEAITTPSPDSAQITFSRDGRRLAYVQRVATRNLQKIPFDRTVEKAIGEPAWVTRGSKLAVMPEMSPQGDSLAFFTIAPSQEDIFVAAADGSGLRQLTDDAYKDRVPRWSPDGKRIAFMSNRSGKYEIWVIDQDGSGLRQVTFTPGKGGTSLPVWSPDGTRLAYTIGNDTTYVIDLRKPWAEQSPQALPRVGAAEWFQGFTFSADGRTLAGFIMQRSGLSAGIATYSFESKRYDTLTDFGLYPVWLKDGQRLIFCSKEKLYRVDVASKKVSEVMYAALSARTGEMLGAASLSPDKSTLYFAQGTIEADVWVLTGS